MVNPLDVQLERNYELYNHSTVMMQNNWKMRCSRAFCDVELQVGPQKDVVVCHRNILVAASDYFQTMYMHEFQESTGQISKVIVQQGDDNITKQVVEAVLCFMYTGSLPNDIDPIIPDIFSLAHMWCLSGLKELCIKKMMEDVSQSNFQQLLGFAKFYDISIMSYKIRSFMARYLPEIYKSEEFLNISEDDVKYLLSDPTTYYHDDLIWMRALKVWSNGSKEKIDFALKEVNFNFVTKTHLQMLSSQKLMDAENISSVTKKEFDLKILEALKTRDNSTPESLRGTVSSTAPAYFPISHYNWIADLDNRMTIGNIITEFKQHFVLLKPIRMCMDSIHEFYVQHKLEITGEIEKQEAVDQSLMDNEIKVLSQAFYHNVIYITVSHSNGFDFPIFAYSYDLNITKPFHCDIAKILHDWKKYSICEKYLHLQGNILFCIVTTVTTNGTNTVTKGRCAILKMDLDNENRDWEVIFNQEHEEFHCHKLQLIEVYEEEITFCAIGGESYGIGDREVIIKLVGKKPWPFILHEITQVPSEIESNVNGDNYDDEDDEDDEDDVDDKDRIVIHQELGSNQLFVFKQGKMHVYDFSTCSWTVLPPMPKQIVGCTMLCINNKLVTIGINDECQVFDLYAESWQSLKVVKRWRKSNKGVPVSA